jgi:S-disulfanyl-L-cysteine oxidoreductase SoxD
MRLDGCRLRATGFGKLRLSAMVIAAALPLVTAIAVHAQTKPAAAKPVAKPAPIRPLGIGRAATADEIKAIDIDVMPDGRGLPPGRGTVAEGAAVYATKCQSCHGKDGAGASAERLVDTNSGPNFNFATDPKLVKTVGNYWPYATTLFDYTQRAMPFTQPGTLAPNETYALTAYILSLNKIVPADAVMDATTLPKVVMPSKNRFVMDNRKGGPVVK